MRKSRTPRQPPSSGSPTTIPSVKQASGLNVLVSGIFRRKQLYITYNDTWQSYPARAQHFIERVWIKKLSTGRWLFDGKLFRVVSYRMREERLFLELENTSYKYFVGSREKEFIEKFGVELTANPLSVGAIVISSDNYVLLGKRAGGLDFEQNGWGTIAGTVDREEDWTRGKPDLIKAIKRELYEEKGIQAKTVQEIVSLGLIYNANYNQTYMPFCAKLNIPMTDLRMNIPKEHEFDGFKYIKWTDKTVSSFIEENHERMSQTCLGNMLLCGKKEFGEKWFEKILTNLPL